MTEAGELEAAARTIIDANLYMTLATADEAGRPWASPVYYAPSNYNAVLLGLGSRHDALAQPCVPARGGDRHLRFARCD
jgi:hypothetical protein